MRRIVPVLFVSFLLGLSACVVDHDEASPVDFHVDEHGEYALFGATYFYVSGANACTSSQRAVILDATRKGRQASQTEEFGTCIAHRLADDYRSCGDDDNDNTENYAQHYWDVLAISQSGNTNNLIIGCEDGWWNGRVTDEQILEYEHDRSQVFWLSNQYVDTTNPTRTKQAKVAGTIWHEVMHTHGYRHLGCGANYSKHRHSLPHIVGSCIQAAYHSSRAIAYAGGDPMKSGDYKTLGAGEYLGADQLSPIDDDGIGSLAFGPGMRVETCGESTWSDLECQIETNVDMSAETIGVSSGGSGLLGDIGRHNVDYVKVEPVAIGYRHSQYRGTYQTFPVGIYRNSNGTLGALPNDSLSSMFIPAGLDVTVCRHEGTGWKSDCARLGDVDTRQFSAELPSRFNDSVSYIEVQPVAVLFSENDFFGERQSFSWGRHLASDGDLGSVGNDNAESLILHDGMWAKVCYHEGSDGRGQTCRTYRRSTRTLGAYRNQVSYIEVGLDLNFDL